MINWFKENITAWTFSAAVFLAVLQFITPRTIDILFDAMLVGLVWFVNRVYKI